MTQARMQVKHYYWLRLTQQDFWRKLLGGQIGANALHGLVRALSISARRNPAFAARTTYQARMLAGWQSAALPTLLLLSGEDYTAREFDELVAADASWRMALTLPRVECHALRGVDHTFSSAEHRQRVADLTRDWLRRASPNSHDF
ncbi:MAG: hypothetical protein MUF16_28440 [Burkholderiaceae bacterium]|nr:hypothetical protein [Burkholderiaceae bacterium]